MAFVKPYTYVDNQVLTAENQKSNDEAAKEYVNQNIGQSDFVDNALGTEEISPGEIEPITKSMRFECNAHYAAHNDIEQLNLLFHHQREQLELLKKQKIEHLHQNHYLLCLLQNSSFHYLIQLWLQELLNLKLW